MTPEPNQTQEFICRMPLAIARERLPIFLSQPPFNLSPQWIELADVENGFEVMCPFQGKTDQETFAMHLRMIDEKWCRRMYLRWTNLDADSDSIAKDADELLCRLLGGEHTTAIGSRLNYPDAAPYAMDAMLSCLRTPDGPFTFSIDDIDEQATHITVVTTMQSAGSRASVIFHIQDIKETSAVIRVIATILADGTDPHENTSLDGEIASWLNQALLAGTTTT